MKLREAGILPEMELELRLSVSSDQNRLIFGGSGPHRPRETNERDLRLDNLVRVVKKESMEKDLDRVLCFGGEVLVLFPMTVNSVRRLFVQTIVREGEGGRKQKLVQFVHPRRGSGYSRSFRTWRRIRTSVGVS